jgi:CheY-like chemotaxis protein
VALPLSTSLSGPGGGAGAALEESGSETAWTVSDREALAGVRLLVVEDDADSREMLVLVFERSGAVVTAVASAAEATEAMRRATPDLLVCDIGLAGMDGHELIREVRALEAEEGGRIPALALTAYASPAHREQALAAGFDRQVSKPVVPEELVAQVALLAGPRGGP